MSSPAGFAEANCQARYGGGPSCDRPLLTVGKKTGTIALNSNELTQAKNQGVGRESYVSSETEDLGNILTSVWED